MIPYGLHGLVCLCTTIVIGATIDILCILIVGQYGMHLMAIAFIARPDNVMRQCCGSKVVRADNALIIVCQCHTSRLDEKAILGSHLHPTFIEIESLIATRAPYCQVLNDGMGLQSLSFIIYMDAVTPKEEMRPVLTDNLIVRSR